MKRCVLTLACFIAAAAGPLPAQTTIGGGICSTASLNGSYSLSLTGRAVNSSGVFSKISQGVGTATFDGESKVTLSLTTNTNSATGVPQTMSGAYTLQANCSGFVSITSGDTASFTLEAYNNPTGSLSKNFLLTGEDGTFAFTGSGGALPSSCSASQITGVYAFNGTSSVLNAGAVSGVGTIAGLLTFNGSSGLTTTWYASTGTSTSIPTVTASGQYSVASGCTAMATVTDSSGQTWNLSFVFTSATGNGFTITGASPTLMFSGSGRTL